ncbi:diacylglycerol/lipid kinase family protein [Sulfobacillus thermosulfidooxidans]|uniref:diacylglycerol/lipid kinase family protein n=1 Tax=Sulfobacillus thermosulfidooxidans TaxID=28034 RepID=UPI0006B682E2|nr:diacylglycerol kinase family protein [Sulfobacillus thermosulfidooxidans]
MAARIIYNPTAGNGRAVHVLESVKPFLEKFDVEIVETQGPGHATQLAQEVADIEDMTVVSLGGDGTHHEVINGLMPSGKAIFSVIPAGTGNDFVRMLRYPKSLGEMVDTALRGPHQWFDLGHIDGQYFLTVAGAGFDAEVAGWVNQRKKQGNGTWVFIRGILYNAFGYRPQPMTVTLEEATRSQNTFMIAIGNTQYYAGGMKICPEANPHDGEFQVVWIEGISPWQVFPLLARVFRGSHVSRKVVKTFPAASLTLEGPKALWVHADGELIGHLPVTVKTIPKAIRVRVGSIEQDVP